MVLLHVRLVAALLYGQYTAPEREGIRRLTQAMGVAWTTVVRCEDRLAKQFLLPREAQKKVLHERKSGLLRTLALALLAALVIHPSVQAKLIDFLPFLGKEIFPTMGAALRRGLALLGGGKVTRWLAKWKPWVRSLVAGKAVYEWERRSRGLGNLALEHLAGVGLHLVVAVPGFLSEDIDPQEEWGGLLAEYPHLGGEIQALHWEAGSRKAAEADLVLGLTPTLHWAAGKAQADIVVLHLTKLLRQRTFGPRPISLVGYSLGARIVLRTLRNLGREGVVDVIDHAVLLGTADRATRRLWLQAQLAVSGRFLNLYSPADRLLRVYGATNWGPGKVVGLFPADTEGITDIDATEMVHIPAGPLPIHGGYLPHLGTILHKLHPVALP
ncbi:DUF726 domain-containing protein [bacterium]|nr:DUF726 domain-containing protein [bacterium]